MNDFEFIFILYSLLLGLSLVELLSGFGRVLEARFTAPDGKQMRVGILTPLLGIFVLLDLLSFWVFAWRVRDLIQVTPFSLLATMLFASAYYLAARLVFPSDPATVRDLDDHFYRIRKLCLFILIALVGVQWAYLMSEPEIRSSLLTGIAIAMAVSLVGLMIAAAFVRRRLGAAVLLVLLIGRYLFIYLR